MHLSILIEVNFEVHGPVDCEMMFLLLFCCTKRIGDHEMVLSKFIDDLDILQEFCAHKYWFRSCELVVS